MPGGQVITGAILPLLRLDGLVIHVHVVLHRGHVFMSQQFLEAERVVAQHQVTDGERMTENVGTHALSEMPMRSVMRLKIGSITPTGHISEFRLPTPGSDPLSITVGPDGNFWFTEGFDVNNRQSGKIGRISPTGQFSGFPLPTAANVPQFLTTGPDGNLWFTEFGSCGLNGKIGCLA